MDAIEAVAILILVVAIVILVYYYLLNSPSTMDKLKSIVPESADAHMDEVLGKNKKDATSEYENLSKKNIELYCDYEKNKQFNKNEKVRKLCFGGVNNE